MKTAKNIIENAIKVKIPSKKPIVIDRACVKNRIYIFNYSFDNKTCAIDCEPETKCLQTIIPDNFLKKCYKKDGNKFIHEGNDGDGVPDNDLIVIVTSKICNESISSYSTTCARENILDRPILGVLNICRNNWNKEKEDSDNIHIIVHELIHIMGFSINNFPYFRNVNGTPLTKRDVYNLPNLGKDVNQFYKFSDKVAVQITRKRSSLKLLNYTKKVWALTLPTVVKVAQAHFDCTQLSEVDLEDYGSLENGINSHFDELLTGNEIMSSVYDLGNIKISKLTMAFLYDTGWYDISFDSNSNLEYGRNKGCDFVLNGCYSFMVNQKANDLTIDPFCNEVQNGYTYFCSINSQYILHCNLNYQLFISNKYVYFNNLRNLPQLFHPENFAGSLPHNEHCPIYTKLFHGNFSSDCHVKHNSNRKDIPYQMWNEFYGNESKCFSTTARKWSVLNQSPSQYGARCFKYSCLHNGSLQIFNNNHTLCTTTNQSLISKIRNYSLKARIICPEYSKICKSAFSFQNSIVPTTEILISTTNKMMNTILINRLIYILQFSAVPILY